MIIGVMKSSTHVHIGKYAFPLPKTKAMRVVLGCSFIVMGAAGFLPIVGYWQIPVGFMILSIDLPFMRRLRRKFTTWWNRTFRKMKLYVTRDTQER